jgi:hypothetical protein
MGRRTSAKPVRPVVFDTDVLIWYFRGTDAARFFVQRVALSRRAISALTQMELIQGCRNRGELALVKEFLQANIASVVHPTAAMSNRALALLEAYSLAHGLRTVDALIAATALEIGADLATANARHYRAIDGLGLLRFKAPPKPTRRTR